MLYIAALVAMARVAKTFGSYVASFFLLVLALACAFGTEFLLHKFTARRVQARTP